MNFTSNQFLFSNKIVLLDFAQQCASRKSLAERHLPIRQDELRSLINGVEKAKIYEFYFLLDQMNKICIVLNSEDLSFAKRAKTFSCDKLIAKLREVFRRIHQKK